MFTKSQIELQSHIEARNDKNREEMASTPGLYIGITVSDPAHWAEQGITTVEQYEYQMEYYGLFDYIANLTSKSNARYLLSLCCTMDDLNVAYAEFNCNHEVA